MRKRFSAIVIIVVVALYDICVTYINVKRFRHDVTLPQLQGKWVQIVAFYVSTTGRKHGLQQHSRFHEYQSSNESIGSTSNWHRQFPDGLHPWNARTSTFAWWITSSATNHQWHSTLNFSDVSARREFSTNRWVVLKLTSPMFPRRTGTDPIHSVVFLAIKSGVTCYNTESYGVGRWGDFTFRKRRGGNRTQDWESWGKGRGKPKRSKKKVMIDNKTEKKISFASLQISG